jgi:hypothetical protein
VVEAGGHDIVLNDRRKCQWSDIYIGTFRLNQTIQPLISHDLVARAVQIQLQYIFCRIVL